VPLSTSGPLHVQRMLDVIHTTYAEHVTLDTLAAALGRQPAYLGRLFRRTVGMTVHECLTHVRLNHAEKMIRDGIKIEAVALSVGYRSKKNFYHQFKRRFEMTPEKYERVCRAPSSTSPAVAEKSRPVASRRAVADRRLIGVIQLAIRFGRETLRVAVRHFTDSPLAMFVTDDGGRYVGANQAALALTGYAASELRDLHPEDLFSNTSTVDTKCLWQAVQPVTRAPANAVLRRKGGELVSVHVMNVKNLLWGRPEMSAMLDELAPSSRT
jgi:PAS domain S-box-containing protein